MPPLVRRYLKTATAFLALGLAIGGWMLVALEFGLRFPARVVSAHTHVILVGFVMMMICGVALWMFPRPAKEDARYKPVRAEWAYWFLTVGTSVRAVAELVAGVEAIPVMRTLIVAAGFAQIAGLLLFFWTMLPRIRSTLPPGS
jgi:cbb3-type cytochrome oxidase subunit 1